MNLADDRIFQRNRPHGSKAVRIDRQAARSMYARNLLSRYFRGRIEEGVFECQKLSDPSPHPCPPPEVPGEGVCCVASRKRSSESAKANRLPFRLRSRRHGVVYVMALGTVLLLTGLALVFSRDMRTEATAAANRASYAQADLVEKAAEQWVIAQGTNYQYDAIDCTAVPAEGIKVGSGYFWIIQPNPVSDQLYMTGIVDESSKLNINTATSAQMQTLPGMTPTAADSIIDWVDPDDTPQPNGAESETYEALSEPYEAKNAAFETVDELLLVNGWSPALLYGYDLNRDGVIDANEQAAAGSSDLLDNANGNSRGMYMWLTCFSQEPNTASDGTARVNVNSASTSKLRQILTTKISASRASQIIARISTRLRSRPGAAFSSLGSFYTNSGMTPTEFDSVYDYLTASTAKTLKGLVNVNTAPEPVLACLPGLTEADANTIIGARASNTSPTSISWLFTALGNSKTSAIMNAITIRSYRYSADIVAVSGDGRSFKRVRVVMDTSSTTTPAQILYRRDMTSYGWPLPQKIQDSLRRSGVVPDDVTFVRPGQSQVSNLSN